MIPDTSVTKPERDAIAAEFQTVMIIDCAWCKKSMGQKDGRGQTGPTSGICESCRDSILGDL